MSAVFELEYCVEETDNDPIVIEIHLCSDNPYRDIGKWTLVRRMAEPGFYLVTNMEGIVLAIHETEFTEVQ